MAHGSDRQGRAASEGVSPGLFAALEELATSDPLVREALGRWSEGSASLSACLTVALLAACQRAPSATRAGDLPSGAYDRPWRPRRPLPVEDPGMELSARESEIAALLGESGTATDIAERLGVSVSTVRNHLKSVYRKLGVHRRADAVRVLESRDA